MPTQLEASNLIAVHLVRAVGEPKQPRSGRLRLQRHDTDQFQLTIRMSLVTVTTPYIGPCQMPDPVPVPGKKSITKPAS